MKIRASLLDAHHTLIVFLQQQQQLLRSIVLVITTVDISVKIQLTKMVLIATMNNDYEIFLIKLNN